MARVASGNEMLGQAKELLVNSRTIEELRQAQAVLLPLEVWVINEANGYSDRCFSMMGLPTSDALHPRRRQG